MPVATTLCIDGVEIWDNRVTQSYVQQYDCEPAPCQVQLMSCFCGEKLEPLPVPLIEDAPWYCADDKASEDFLGLYMIMAEGHDTREWSREMVEAYCPDGQCGGTLGSLRTNMRIMTFTVMGIGKTCAGGAYGKRWLLDNLQGQCGPTGRGACPYTIQVTDCCTSNPDGTPRTWDAHNAGVFGNVEFENVCECMVWKATFQIVMQPYFFDCQTIDECAIVPGTCAPDEIDADDWASRYFGLCGAKCETKRETGIEFAQSCDEIIINQILMDGNACGDGRSTPCNGLIAPDCFPKSTDSCLFFPPKPVKKPSKCAPCVSSNVSDWGTCCYINEFAPSEDVIFDIDVYAGEWDVHGVEVAIFESCPTNDPDRCLPPIWSLTIPRMNAESNYRVSGINCNEVFNCGGNDVRGSKIGAYSEGSTVLSCGHFYAAVRVACLDDPDIPSFPSDFSVSIKPIIRRASL